MRARIYQPAKTAMQSGTARTNNWVLEFPPASSREVDPLMGWTSSADTQSQVRLQYESRNAELERAVQERDFENIRKIAHKYKGTVGQLFAHDAKDLAQLLVDKADAKDDDNLNVFFDQFKTMLQKLYEELQELKTEYLNK